MRQRGLCLLLFIGTLSSAAVAAPSDTLDTSVREHLQRMRPFEMDEVLWLARCVLSETNRAHEQRLVAWVVRNRYETGYRGDTYREVVLEPRQFSAFNAPSPRRTYLLSLNQNSMAAAWRQALRIAMDVYEAPAAKRPFPITTRHFYSPVSMAGGRTPPWAARAEPLPAASLNLDDRRFRFYDGIDAALDPPVLTDERTADRSPTVPTLRRSGWRPRLKLSGRVRRPARPWVTRPDRKQ